MTVASFEKQLKDNRSLGQSRAVIFFYYEYQIQDL